MLFCEFAGGEMDKLGPRGGNVGCGGELCDGKFVADSGGDFLDDEFGGRADDSGAKEFVFRVGEKFDKTVAEVGSVGGGDSRERQDGFFASDALFDAVIFGEASGGDRRESVSEADEAFVIAEVFGLADGVGGSKSAFVGGALEG